VSNPPAPTTRPRACRNFPLRRSRPWRPRERAVLPKNPTVSPPDVLSSPPRRTGRVPSGPAAVRRRFCRAPPIGVSSRSPRSIRPPTRTGRAPPVPGPPSPPSPGATRFRRLSRGHPPRSGRPATRPPAPRAGRLPADTPHPPTARNLPHRSRSRRPPLGPFPALPRRSWSRLGGRFPRRPRTKARPLPFDRQVLPAYVSADIRQHLNPSPHTPRSIGRFAAFAQLCTPGVRARHPTRRSGGRRMTDVSEKMRPPDRSCSRTAPDGTHGRRRFVREVEGDRPAV